MSYQRRVQVEFNHCDPAGIVFYPRYFEMVNSVVENFFADVLAYPFRRIHLDEGAGVPTVSIAANFTAPSRLGDVLNFSLTVRRVGRTSLDLTIAAEGRMRADVTLVWVKAGRAAAWPAEIGEKLIALQEDSL